MQKAVSEGKLIELMASSDYAVNLSSQVDDENYRIGSELLQVNAGVGVITVKGSLVAEHKWYNSLFGIVSYDQIRDAFMLASEDAQVKSILLDIESPGGVATFIDSTSDYIRNIDRNIKPVYGHTTSHAHSAGYWLLASTRKISAAKMASVGSIGVIMTLVNYQKMYQDAGIEFTYLRSGKFKALGQRGEKLSPEAEADYLDTVMQLYGFFESHVLTSRGSVASQNKGKWSEGKTFFAKESIAIGLVDEINTFDGHISKLYDTSYIHFNSTMTDIQLKTFGDTAMKLKLLSPEQAAKFASGVPVDKLGLSTDDLSKVEAELANTEVATKGEGSADNVEAGTEETQEVEAGTEETAETKAVDVDKIIELSSKLAKVEVKLEAAEAAIVSLEAEKTKFTEMQTKLVGIVGEATGRFQVALGKSASDFKDATAESIVSQYETEKTTLFGEMPAGTTSSQTVNDREMEDNRSLQQKNENTIIKIGAK
jgi:signal peptide peptidase SppA